MEQQIRTARSPISQPIQGPLNFFQALEAVTHQDATITKLEWADDTVYGALRDELLMIHRDDEWFKWIVNEGDLLGEDWIIRN